MTACKKQSYASSKDSSSMMSLEVRLLEVPNIPPYFRCPITFNLMGDPVSLCTGVSYDRESIERWLDEGHNTCPVTMQVLQDQALIPNHTLRRLIQDWCVVNGARGVDRIPTPKIPAEPRQVQLMLIDVSNRFMLHQNLMQIRALAVESENNRKCLVEAGAIPVLASLLTARDDFNEQTEDTETSTNDSITVETSENALAILALLPLRDQLWLHDLKESKQLASICWFLSYGASGDARSNAAMLLGKLASEDDAFKSTITFLDGAMEGLVSLLEEGVDSNSKGVVAALECLAAICVTKRNRVQAENAGVVPQLLKLLTASETEIAESVVPVLELFSGCAEVRATVCEHKLAIPALVKILATGSVASKKALGILWVICRSSPDIEVHLMAIRAGMFAKLLILVQSDHSPETKAKASELLKLLQRSWNESSQVML